MTQVKRMGLGVTPYTNLWCFFDSVYLIIHKKKAKKIFKDLILKSAQYNMQINAKKTKAMVVTRE